MTAGKDYLTYLFIIYPLRQLMRMNIEYVLKYLRVETGLLGNEDATVI